MNLNKSRENKQKSIHTSDAQVEGPSHFVYSFQIGTLVLCHPNGFVHVQNRDRNENALRGTEKEKENNPIFQNRKKKKQFESGEKTSKIHNYSVRKCSIVWCLHPVQINLLLASNTQIFETINNIEFRMSERSD